MPPAPRLSAGYIAQALRGRGARAPDKAVIERYIASLSADDAAVAQSLVRRISLGVDSSGEVESFLERLGAMEAAPVEPGAERRVPQEPPADSRQLGFLRSHGIHIYGKQAALKVELDRLKTEPDAPPEYTVLVEGARNSDKGFDWTHKIPFQLTRRELPVLAAFLLGYSAQQKLDIKFHGSAQEKSLHVDDQGGNLFVRLSRGSERPIAVPVEPPDVFAWGELCLIALQMNRPAVSQEAQLALLRRIGNMTPGKAK